MRLLDVHNLAFVQRADGRAARRDRLAGRLAEAAAAVRGGAAPWS